MNAATSRALGWWWASRLGVAVLSLAGAWTLTGARAGEVPGFLFRWDRWDAQLLKKVAEFGYQGYPRHYPDRGVVAFFPGQPLAERFVHLFGPGWIAAGLIVSALAGSIAAVALSRVAELDGPAGVGPRAVLLLVLSPYAVFLAAGYSEALFLAFALPAWLAARRGSWAAAGLLAAGAASVRITGLFLLAGLVVEYAVQHRGRLRSADAGWLLVPLLPVALYAAYVHGVTGDWLAWQHAQADVWHRTFTAPWRALQTTWRAAFDNPAAGAEYVWSFRAEIAAVLVGVGLTGVLLWLRRWAEATYVGLQVAALATSSFYLSVARATLLWWPLWVLLAQAGLRRPWLHTLYLAVAAPLMAVMVLTFTAGRWVG